MSKFSEFVAGFELTNSQKWVSCHYLWTYVLFQYTLVFVIKWQMAIDQGISSIHVDVYYESATYDKINFMK